MSQPTPLSERVRDILSFTSKASKLGAWHALEGEVPEGECKAAVTRWVQDAEAERGARIPLNFREAVERLGYWLEGFEAAQGATTTPRKTSVRDMDRWFREQIAAPVTRDWGNGWAKLGEDQKRDAVLAACARNLRGQARLETAGVDAGDAAALGRHVVDLLAASDRWLSTYLPE